jgi:predicted DNA-binding transcriptional regulator YafY
MKLTETLKSLIVEEVALDQVINAVKNKRKIIIYYDGDEPGGRGLREIEPVCIGRTKGKKNLAVRAWDSEGASHRGFLGTRPMPGWRLFKLNKIITFKDTGETFDEPRPNFNFSGDKSLEDIIIIAQFGNNPEEQNLA